MTRILGGQPDLDQSHSVSSLSGQGELMSNSAFTKENARLNWMSAEFPSSVSAYCACNVVSSLRSAISGWVAPRPEERRANHVAVELDVDTSSAIVNTAVSTGPAKTALSRLVRGSETDLWISQAYVSNGLASPTNHCLRGSSMKL